MIRREWQEFYREFGMSCEFTVFLDGDDELYAFLDATDAYKLDGNVPALYRALLALGVPADQIRWHAEHRGRTMVIQS